MSDIRYDRFHDLHVIIAPERLSRPDCSPQELKPQTDTTSCPFCEGNEEMTPPEIFAIRNQSSYKDEKGWQTRVVPNLYKAVQIESPCEHHYGAFEHWDGFGAHEVIIDTPQHHTSMTQWSEENISNWLKTLRTRVADLSKDHRIAYISLFKNEGTQAGSTQEHSHSQLIGLPFIPKLYRESYERNYTFYKQHGHALLESILHHEEQNKDRIVSQNEGFTAFCPYASAYPFEMMISSKKALGQIHSLSDESIHTLAPLLLASLKALKKQLGCFDFNLSISTPPLQENSLGNEISSCINEANRFYLRIMPRIYKHGGFELNTGIIINPVAPELAAKLLSEGMNV